MKGSVARTAFDGSGDERDALALKNSRMQKNEEKWDNYERKITKSSIWARERRRHETKSNGSADRMQEREREDDSKKNLQK